MRAAKTIRLHHLIVIRKKENKTLHAYATDTKTVEIFSRLTIFNEIIQQSALWYHI